MPEEVRVLGCLAEKHLATPQHYPLTENALIAACNQSTNRDPVVSYDQSVVRPALISLREQGLAKRIRREGERAEKHAHRLDDTLGLEAGPLAVLAVLLLAPGTPMLLMGDEARRTQRGNNNAYCQDNVVSWFDWSMLEQNRDLLHCVRRLIRLRRDLGVPTEGGRNLQAMLELARVRWHGVRLDQPDWSERSRSLACTMCTAAGQYEAAGAAFHVRVAEAYRLLAKSEKGVERIDATDEAIEVAVQVLRRLALRFPETFGAPPG